MLGRIVKTGAGTNIMNLGTSTLVCVGRKVHMGKPWVLKCKQVMAALGAKPKT